MKVALCGSLGEHFCLDSKQKIKLKKSIIKYLLSCEIRDNTCDLNIKADDGFGLVATEACFEYIKQKELDNYRISFFCFYNEDFEELSDEIKKYYTDKIEYLQSLGTTERGRPLHVLDGTCGFGSRSDKADEYKASFSNCYYRYIDNATCLVTYLDKKSNGDKLLKRVLNYYDSPDKMVVDLYAASNSLYDNSNYTGIRKQKNSSKYYYRINIKLPDGTPVNIEKGAFFTAAEADKVRREHIIFLTTQNCENADKTVDEVFNEFISVTCKDKASLEKKYRSYYNSRIKETMGILKIGETKAELQELYTVLTKYQVKDNRSKDKTTNLSQGYVSGLRAMLCNLFDYAYNMKYIQSHPMYALPSKWTINIKNEIPEKKEYIKPLFPYTGNKLKLLPELFKLFPKDIENLNFIDLFGGSAVVALNTNAKRVLINEGDRFLVSIYEGISRTPPQKAWELVESIIEEYHLTPTDKEAFEYCRRKYNEVEREERLEKYWYWGLCLIYFSFSSNTVRHNEEYEFLPTFGNGRATMKANKEKFFPFAEKLYNGNYSFYTSYYKYMTRDGIPRNEIFFYADPPYLITKAEYNKGWNREKEEELYDFLESCHKQELRWMLSNVTHNNGKENDILINWLKKVQEKYKGEIHVYYLDRDYKFCSYQRKNAGKTVEIVVTNYVV